MIHRPSPRHHRRGDGCQADCDWQPIACGGGVGFPGHPEHRPLDDACPDCQTTIYQERTR